MKLCTITHNREGLGTMRLRRSSIFKLEIQLYIYGECVQQKSASCLVILLYVRQCVTHIYILTATKGAQLYPPYPLDLPLMYIASYT